jgi:nucleoside-diphosphate-sugar epimerase
VRLLLTGTNGVVGSALVRRLAINWPTDTEVVGVFSSPASLSAFAARLGALAKRVRPVVCDLTAASAAEDLAAELGGSNGTVVVHAAASVAWNRSLAEMWGPNVDATRAVATCARRTSDTARMIYISSAYAGYSGSRHRNTYEATKMAAENLLREEFADLEPTMFATSLVVGSRVDGQVDGFHGVYPLLKLVAEEVPFLVGSRTARIDVVPVDWVASELVALLRATLSGEPTEDVVAATGSASLTLPRLVAVAVEVLNAKRETAGLVPMAETPVLSFRQWGFIRRSLEAWEVPGIDRHQLERFERLLGIYTPYLKDSASRAPRNVREPAPCPSSYLEQVVSYWWHRERHRTRRPRRYPRSMPAAP